MARSYPALPSGVRRAGAAGKCAPAAPGSHCPGLGPQRRLCFTGLRLGGVVVRVTCRLSGHVGIATDTEAGLGINSIRIIIGWTEPWRMKFQRRGRWVSAAPKSGRQAALYALLAVAGAFAATAPAAAWRTEPTAGTPLPSFDIAAACRAVPNRDYCLEQEVRAKRTLSTRWSALSISKRTFCTSRARKAGGSYVTALFCAEQA